MNSLPMMILSIFVFAYFKNINIQQNKIIEILAKSSFSVYLIHLNPLIINYLFFNILKIQNFYDKNLFLLMAYVIIMSVIIYIVCTIIDNIRIQLIEKQIFKIKKLDKYVDKINQIMDI